MYISIPIFDFLKILLIIFSQLKKIVMQNSLKHFSRRMENLYMRMKSFSPIFCIQLKIKYWIKEVCFKQTFLSLFLCVVFELDFQKCAITIKKY